MKQILIILMLGLCWNNGLAQTYNGNKKDINKILNNIKSFSEYIMHSDYKKLGESYTDDAKIFPQKGEIIAGREKILGYWVLPEDIATSYHKIIPSEITIVKNTAYDYGYYEGTTRKANGEESSWKGKYVIVWKKIKGEWKIYLDIWNNL